MTEELTVFEEGFVFFHGTSVEDEFEDLEGPAWVSESEAVAIKFGDVPEPAKRRWIAAGRPPRVLTFVAVRDIELLTIRDTAGFMRIARVDSMDDFDFDAGELADFVCRDGYDGWIVPGNYGAGSDIMLCNPEDVLEYVDTRYL